MQNQVITHLRLLPRLLSSYSCRFVQQNGPVTLYQHANSRCIAINTLQHSHRFNGPAPCQSHIRLYSTNETASTPKPDKNKPAASDHSPESLGELVYTGNINKGVFVAKYFSVGSSVIGLCLTPWIVSEMSTGGLVFKIAVTTASGFFILVTPLLIHFLCKRYVVKMYYDKASSTFSAVKLNLLAQQRVFKFKPNEIKDSLTNPLCTVEVRDQGFLLDTDDLMNTNPDAYVAFMRYDQPIDLDKYTVDPKTGPSASDKKTVSGDDQ